MISMRAEIVDMIIHATELYCYYMAPPMEATFPCIVYNEVVNSDYVVVKGNEYANLAYTFTIYCEDPMNILAIAYKIDEVLKYKGFIKDYTSPDMFAEGYYSKTLRFKAIVNHKGEIFN
jgi:hypothetical protein